jgi:hypothetical protein
LWNKFDTEENIGNKEAQILEQRRQLEESLMNSSKNRFHRTIGDYKNKKI